MFLKFELDSKTSPPFYLKHLFPTKWYDKQVSTLIRKLVVLIPIRKHISFIARADTIFMFRNRNTQGIDKGRNVLPKDVDRNYMVLLSPISFTGMKKISDTLKNYLNRPEKWVSNFFLRNTKRLIKTTLFRGANRTIAILKNSMQENYIKRILIFE